MAKKIYIENGQVIPSIKILDAITPAPVGFTEATTIANFFKYGAEYGLTEVETLTEIVALITDWTTHDAGEKQQVLNYVQANHFTASITTEIRDDLTAPYKGFKIFNITTGKTEWWNGSSWTSNGTVSALIIPLSFSLNRIYGHTSTSYAGIPLQVMLPKLNDLGTFTKIEAKLVVDYETEGGATMAIKLFNYTDFVDVPGFEFNLPNQVWGHGASGWVDITSVEGNSLRIYTKRVGGGRTNNVKIEGAVLILKYS